MVDKIYYAAVLSILTGLIVWAMKAFIGSALKSMANELGHVKEGLNSVDKKLDNKTVELKNHFDKTCIERQNACARHVDNRIKKLEAHGHRGLEGEGNRHTY